MKKREQLIGLSSLKRVSIVERVRLDFGELGKREVASVNRIGSVLNK